MYGEVIMIVTLLCVATSQSTKKGKPMPFANINRRNNSSGFELAHEYFRDTRRASERHSRARIYSSCLVPPQPTNGKWQLERYYCDGDEDCDAAQGVLLAPGNQLIYKCEPGFQMMGNHNVVCLGRGRWSSIPSCVEIECNSLISESRKANCYRNGNPTSCDQNLLPETTAEVFCRSGYQQDTSSTLTGWTVVECNSNGEWYPDPIKCIPVCGVPTNRQRPFVYNGSIAQIPEFPWHASLYMDTGAENAFVCGATIIHSKLLLTAAHCVYDETRSATISADALRIAAGNVFRDYDSPVHDPLTVQKRMVRHIYRHCAFDGLHGNYAADVALLELDERLNFSEILLPACLDVTGYGNQILEPGAKGKVAGFGRTETGNLSQILMYAWVPYVSYVTCKQSTQAYISADKFCAGYTNGTAAVCEGDSGGGLVFLMKNLWHVMGIVSVGLGEPLPGNTCQTHVYTAYTKVSNYITWIQKILFKIEHDEDYVSACDSGCTPFNSSSTITECMTDGRWTSCDSLISPNQDVKLSCRVGYRMDKNGDAIVKCSPNGTWDPEPITCIPNELLIGAACELPNGGTGICTLPSNCSTNILSSSNLSNTSCGFTGATPNVCCSAVMSKPSGERRSPTSIDESHEPITSRNREPGAIARRKCNEYAIYRSEYGNAPGLNQPKNRSRCNELVDENLMLVLSDARPQEFPFMALIGGARHGEDITWLCAGALISEQFVIAPAVCARLAGWPIPRWVIVGNLDMERVAEPQLRRITDIILHPKFKLPALYDNVALYKLESPLNLDAWVVPACLQVSASIDSTSAIRTSLSDPDSLGGFHRRKVRLPLVDQFDCSSSFHTGFRTPFDFVTRLHNGVIDDSIVCTVHNRITTNQVGSMGNPLVSRSTGHPCMYNLLGLESFYGDNYSHQRLTGYERISHYIEWIEKNVWPEA